MSERRFPDFDAFAARLPLVAILGLRELDDDEAGRPGLALEPRADLLQPEGVVHGGIQATLADTIAVWAGLREMPPERTLTSVEFKLNFLRAARSDGGELVARAKVLRAGSRVVVVDAEVTQGGEAVTRGLFTYLVVER